MVPLDVSINGKVFPTLVGVFPQAGFWSWDIGGLPHARGGVSRYVAFVDPAGGLPHARGGVSLTALDFQATTTSSPRSWGCFHAIVL